MPKAPRTTTDPLGQKLLQVLKEKGYPDDLVYLAKEMGVKVPSTYDWIKHGRLAKERYARLVEWSGRSLHWWFDIPHPLESSGPMLARETPPAYSNWPLPGIQPSDFSRYFTPEMRSGLVSYAMGMLQTAQMMRSGNGTRG